MTKAIQDIQQYIDNKLDPELTTKAVLTGIIGDRPSQGAKSPVLWNAAYRSLDMDAAFLPFDVTTANLGNLVDALRETPDYVGGSVTMPYKSRIMDHLDELDSKAQQIGAVNTVARGSDGRLIGYNTDAQGAIDCLKKTMPWNRQPFLPNLDGLRVLLIGAGGAGRAVAFSIAEEIGAGGRLVITNRSPDTATELASSVNHAYGNTTSIIVDQVQSALTDVDLIINASLRGQSGTRLLSDGRTTCLEPYSALGSADTAALLESEYQDSSAFQRAWYEASLDGIIANHTASSQAVLKAKPNTAYFDVVYAPLETKMLAQARLAGYPTLNGKGMNLAQAVDGFVNRALRSFIGEQGWDIAKVYDGVFESMAQIW